MAGRPWILAETSWGALRDTEYHLAALPWGATEPHNYHLPYGTDVYESEAVVAEAARLAWEQGVHVLVLPCVPFGVNTQHLDLPGTVNMNPSTQAAVLDDVIESIEAWNLDKMVVVNGHGGNDFRQMIREAQARTEVFLSQVHWFRIPGALDGFDDPGDHAGEAETSLMMHLHPDLVGSLDQAGDGAARAWRIQAIREGWAWAPRRWSAVTEDTGVGDPAPATAEKGAAWMDTATRKLAEYFAQVAAADPDDLYG
ncbi:MAG: creatininase family protein [Longimicrobiales bacterium]